MTKESLLQVLETFEEVRRRYETNRKGIFIESEEQERLEDIKRIDQMILEVKKKLESYE